jgi:hypothetical protein
MSRTRIIAAETFDRFSTFGGEVFTEGSTIRESDGPIETAYPYQRGYEFAFEAAVDERRNLAFEYDLDFRLDDDLGEAYLKSLHAQVPRDHSLVGRFDDWARARLLKPTAMEGLWGVKAKYCAATAEKMVELGLAGEVPGIGIWTPFPGGTMAALLDCSLFDAPEPARLDQLLDESAKALIEKLEAAIEYLRARRREQLARLRGE